MGDPFQTLERIIDEWPDLELEEQHQSWRLFPVNSACTWSSANELSSPAYVLTRKGNPFHFLRPHGVLEVVWGHRQWTTAIARPKWINNYHCLGIFAQVCGPMLTPSFASWCDNTRLREELVECSIGSFVQVHIKATCSDLVRIDLQAALQRSIHTLHLPGDCTPILLEDHMTTDIAQGWVANSPSPMPSDVAESATVVPTLGAAAHGQAAQEEDLANHQRQDPSLPHWPAAARWWHSRLKLIGPHKEKTELLLFPISASTGLHHVHPTWAGTFVLAALVAVFPGINFVLLDSDCLPVTLFEVEDLWTEAYLARFPAHCESGIPQAHPLRALARFCKDPQVVYTQSRVCSTRMGQGALVVTEPHAELNAGLIVIFRSFHPPLFDWNAWSLRLRSSPGSITEDEFKDEASNVTFAFWDRIGEFLKRSRTGSELSPDEKTLWIQSGLALSPLMGTCLQYSLDFCLAWALIGTTIDFRVLPPSLSEREKLLMLSCWQQWDAAGVPGSALSQWLVGIDVDSGPDGRNSPTFLKQNFDVQEAADLYQAVHLHTLEDLVENGPYPKVISQLALRIITYEYPLEAILAIYYLPATGYLPAKFPHDQWNEAVRWHGDTKLAAIIHNEAEWADANIILSKLGNVVVEAESQHGVVVWSSTQNCPSTIFADSYLLQLIVLSGEEIQRHLPETLHVEATGLGGRDLLYPIPWDISIRSDKEGQSIYGPSLAPMEENVDVPAIFGGTETVQVTALGRSKAAHEFLVLHYFGLDSAKHWDALLFEVLPAVQFPGHCTVPPQNALRKSFFHQLPAQEQASQKEEAYARATVALTRAQQICFIMGPLDMRGLVGAATIIGCLKYGASFSGLDDQDNPVFLIRLKDEDLLESPDDSAFLQSLRFSCARVNGVYPPLALVEAYITEEDSAPRVRRLHLMVVDLRRRRRMADRVLRLLVHLQVDRCAEECLHTLPIPWKRNQEAYQLRYVFGYAMEGSDLPCYILWPTRTAEQSFWCIDAWKGDWVRLDKCAYMAPLGIEHFFDAFCFDPQRPWGTAAIQALGIPSCRVSKDAYLENMHVNTFLLTPRRIPVERKASAAKREVDQDMVAREESVSEVGSDAESGWSEVSDNSSTDSECTDIEASSIASDQDRFDTAYEAFRDLANDLYYIDLRRYSRGITSEDAAGVLLLDGHEKLQELVHLPRTWPLARLTIPLEGLSKQIDRLLEGYCFQILATNRYPEAHNGRVLQTATHLTWILAEYLADTIAWLMRSILGHDSKILFDKDTQLLLTPKFWLLPLYREFLNSARRPSPASERARGCTGLVKVICKENKEQKGKRKYHACTPHPNIEVGFSNGLGHVAS
eukprot:symbB.v1.2.039461.t1/scaffold6579.1/size16916/1